MSPGLEPPGLERPRDDPLPLHKDDLVFDPFAGVEIKECPVDYGQLLHAFHTQSISLPVSTSPHDC